MAAGAPFVKRRRIFRVGDRTGAVAAAANGGGNFNLRNSGGIVRRVRVIGRGAVAILALHAGEIGGVGKNSALIGEIETGRQAVSDRMAGQAQAVGLAACALNAGLMKALA